MLLVVGAITALSKFVFHVELGIGTPLVALIIGATSLVTMLVALVVAWGAGTGTIQCDCYAMNERSFIVPFNGWQAIKHGGMQS